ncbi:MAG: LytTR family transcriptional regulator [Saprospiraceae bacterium]|nr:LytTR family transcriptional regulator [Saprospiraceae bacterium]
MKIFELLHTPFPRPVASRKTILLILFIGLAASGFILLYKPFGIENTTGELYVDLVIFSLGILFILSILFIEFFIPLLVPKPFQRWTLGKALLWYPIVIVFVGGCQFLYKSYWAGWHDFTFLEFVFVLFRTLGISFTVAFFVLGIWQYLNRKRLSMLTSKEVYDVMTSDGKVVQLGLNNILYIASSDNYVEVHIEENGDRHKLILRSSLKKIETQISNPLSPIIRCNRRYLININRFIISSESSRKMDLILVKYEDSIPVSTKYIPQIKQRLTVRP